MSVARQSGPWVLMSPWASQPPLPPPAWQIWMNRTPSLRQPARQQQLPAEVVGLVLADAVEVPDVLRLAGEVDDLRRGELHPGGQLVGLRPGPRCRTRWRSARGTRGSGPGAPASAARARRRLLALGRLQVRDRRLARLERSGGHARAEVAAGQLHRRGRPADVHERRQVLVGAPQRVRDPAPEGRVIELAGPGARCRSRSRPGNGSPRGTTSTGPRRSRRSRRRRAGTSRRPGCPTCRTG